MMEKHSEILQCYILMFVFGIEPLNSERQSNGLTTIATPRLPTRSHR